MLREPLARDRAVLAVAAQHVIEVTDFQAARLAPFSHSIRRLLVVKNAAPEKALLKLLSDENSRSPGCVRTLVGWSV